MSEYLTGYVIKKTRKDRRCWLCGDIIPKGSSCFVGVCKDDTVFRFYYHLDCHNFAQKNFTDDDWEFSENSIARDKNGELSKKDEK